ncbi:MAG: bifunctional proline dehydrogenase/L-glutamate gamma-semialdehyde dehydrogenase PutA [Rhodospirillales bacterium]
MTIPDDRSAIRRLALAPEDSCLAPLIVEADWGEAATQRITATATGLVEGVRRHAADAGALDNFLAAYDLGSREGVMLMCLAEALLRIPDATTADRLIAEKIGGADWATHLGHSDSLFVNASTWALMLTGRFVRLSGEDIGRPQSLVRRLVARSGDRVIRQALAQGMRIIGRQFVFARTIGDALQRAKAGEAEGDLHSFDMLGEQALTRAAAEHYRDAYRDAIVAIGAAAAGRGPYEGPGISIKLSALHPRFAFSQRERVLKELVPDLLELLRLAKASDIGVCIDSEEADRFELTLDVLAAVVADSSLTGWDGLGFALQAYQKRARPAIDWLADLARRCRRRLALRLVKGAYWDAEIKHAQERGLAGYPVFTRKNNTDVSYLAAARAILSAADAFRPAFATHNAHTVAAVLELAGSRRDLEFQRLHGMGVPLYAELRTLRPDRRCRVYSPVGGHRELLAYLVRRLLENGSNTSFVNRLVDATLPVERIVADPVARARALKHKAHPAIPLPTAIFGAERLAARGLDLADPDVVSRLASDMAAAGLDWHAAPLLAGGRVGSAERSRPISSPADRGRIVGHVEDASATHIANALGDARAFAAAWDATPVVERAACLDRAASLLEERTPTLAALVIAEAGKTIPDSLADITEAVDFCRYYAARGRADFGAPLSLPGPAGEDNRLTRHGRGVFVCISPWNFPVAIFIGQIAAALVAGNVVVAKPAEQTCLVAQACSEILHEAGVPVAALQVLPGDGRIGEALVSDPGIAGVAFTGGTATAQAIGRRLAGRAGPIVPFIAETGGQNVMLVDSSALPEQVVADVLVSAFQSAGQRCSALRVLCLQRDVATPIKAMLAGAMEQLAIGDPARLATDVGPVIDAAALDRLTAHATRMETESRLLFRCRLPPECASGTFFAPAAYEIDRFDVLTEEVFGPVLHVLEYDAHRLDALLDTIDASGYGLTLGIHSRIESFVRRVEARMRVGNMYVNRTMIGARVGCQPFGGERMSGTGPKAGGPWYLPRFATERVIAVDTTASGGNAALLALDEAADA